MHLPPGIAGDALLGRRCAPNRRPRRAPAARDSLIGHATAIAGLGADPFTADRRPGLHHRPLQRRAVRPVDREPRQRRPVRLRQRRRALDDQRRPQHGRGHDRQRRCRRSSTRPITDTGIPLQLQADQRDRRPPELPVQPDQLHPADDHGDADGGAQGAASARSPRRFQVANCASLPFKPTLTAVDAGQREQSQRREPDRQGRPRRPGQANIAQNQARAADRAALAPDDDPESVPRRGLRSQPGDLPRRLDHRHGDRAHAGAQEPADRPGLPRLARQRRLPRRRVRAPGRRRSR